MTWLRTNQPRPDNSAFSHLVVFDSSTTNYSIRSSSHSHTPAVCRRSRHCASPIYRETCSVWGCHLAWTQLLWLWSASILGTHQAGKPHDKGGGTTRVSTCACPRTVQATKTRSPFWRHEINHQTLSHRPVWALNAAKCRDRNGRCPFFNQLSLDPFLKLFLDISSWCTPPGSRKVSFSSGTESLVALATSCSSSTTSIV